MATKHPRLQVVMEKPLYAYVASLAEKDGVSMSTKARDLIKDAVEHLEDAALLAIVEERMKKPGKFLTTKQVKRRLGL